MAEFTSSAEELFNGAEYNEDVLLHNGAVYSDTFIIPSRGREHPDDKPYSSVRFRNGSSLAFSDDEYKRFTV